MPDIYRSQNDVFLQKDWQKLLMKMIPKLSWKAGFHSGSLKITI